MRNDSIPTILVHGIPYVNMTPYSLHIALKKILNGTDSTVIFTPNATIAAKCDRDKTLRDMILQADLLLPDGFGVMEAARLAGTPLQSRLTGIDTGEDVLSIAAHAPRHLPVYFLGGKPGVAEQAAAHWQEIYPTLRIAGTHHGYFSHEGRKNEDILQHIDAKESAIVFVCLGFPDQEKWILENKNRLPGVRLWMGLGGSFDVWAGKVRRAPELFRKIHLEWLWRSIRNPQKLREIPDMFRFVFGKIPDTSSRQEKFTEH